MTRSNTHRATGVWLRKDLYSQVQQMAKDLGLSMSATINLLIELALDKKEG